MNVRSLARSLCLQVALTGAPWLGSRWMQRIAIIGISGSGKTTFAHTLQRATGLPLHHADQLFWRGPWQPVPADQYLEAHSE